MSVVYKENTSKAEDIFLHFKSCDSRFYEDLSSRVHIKNYAAKLEKLAFRHEAWKDDQLIGLVAIYYNEESGVDFITNVSVSENYTKLGIASHLVKDCIRNARNAAIQLEVSKYNSPALKLYEKFQFICHNEDETSFHLRLQLDKVNS